MTTLATPAVGRPLARERIRAVEEGYLVECSALRCRWQGLFARRERAVAALDTHLARSYRQGITGHRGKVVAHLVQLLDERTARCATDSIWTQHTVVDADGSLAVEFGFSFEDEAPFPRTQGDVSELVETGDLIDVRGREGKVWKVTETRSLGLPTWTILYVDPDRDGWPDPTTEWQRGRDQSWLNELVVVDGVATCRYDGEQYPVVGADDEYQALLGGFAGGEGGASG